MNFSIEAAEAALRSRLDNVEVAILDTELRVTDGEAIVDVLTSYPPGEDADDGKLLASKESSSRLENRKNLRSFEVKIHLEDCVASLFK